MNTTVYFATNRALTGPPEARRELRAGDRGAPIPPPSPTARPLWMASISRPMRRARFRSSRTPTRAASRQQAIGDLSDPGRSLLVFIHGFDNTFSDAITRAAFNREWLAASGVAAADATVIAFSWPSAGQILSFPVLQADYIHDQMMANHSGIHLMTLLRESGADPARCAGRRALHDAAGAQHGQPGASGGGRELVPARQRRRCAVPGGGAGGGGLRLTTCSTRRRWPASMACRIWRSTSRSISARPTRCSS